MSGYIDAHGSQVVVFTSAAGGASLAIGTTLAAQAAATGCTGRTRITATRAIVGICLKIDANARTVCQGRHAPAHPIAANCLGRVTALCSAIDFSSRAYAVVKLTNLICPAIGLEKALTVYAGASLRRTWIGAALSADTTIFWIARRVRTSARARLVMIGADTVPAATDFNRFARLAGRPAIQRIG